MNIRCRSTSIASRRAELQNHGGQPHQYKAGEAYIEALNHQQITLLGGAAAWPLARRRREDGRVASRRWIMTSGTDISALYREFTDALTEVLAENAVGPARRGRLARARAAVKKHPDYSESGYFLAVETAFKNWEAMQNIGR